MYSIFYKQGMIKMVFLLFPLFFMKSIVSLEKINNFAPRLRNRTCPDGGIGRRAGLKHLWIHFHPGSTPGLGTKIKAKC